MDAYDFIVLPPDAFHMTLWDRMADARRDFADALAVVERIKRPDQRLLVKYRSGNQRANFPCAHDARIGYGQLMDYCGKGTAVIGPPGSAAWECWLNDIAFYPFWDYRRYAGNRYTSMDAVARLNDIVYLARTGDELYENIVNRRIFRPGKSKRDLVHHDGMYLHQIVHHILHRQKEK